MEKEDGNTLNVKDTDDFYNQDPTINQPDHPPTEVALNFPSTLQLMKTDVHTHFFTENNNEFLEETGIDELMTNGLLVTSLLGDSTKSHSARYHRATK